MDDDTRWIFEHVNKECADMPGLITPELMQNLELSREVRELIDLIEDAKPPEPEPFLYTGT